MGEKFKILVIDDDSGIRDSLAECMAAEGFAVATAINGQDGLERLRRERPGLVVVDLVMPVMNGHQFVAAVRADPALRDLPVVLMTGATPRSGHPQPAVDALLPKPFELEELIAVVKRFLA